MDFTIIIAPAITAITAIIGSWFAFRNKSTTTLSDAESKFREDLLAEIKILKKDLITLRNDNVELHQTLLLQEVQIKELQMQLKENFNYTDILKSYYELVPIPAWLKTKEGRMVFINPSYEKMFNITKLEYEGKTDIEVWGKEIGSLYKKNDIKTMNSKKGTIFKEPIYKNSNNKKLGYTDCLAIKFPIYIKGKLFGTGGFIIDKNLIK